MESELRADSNLLQRVIAAIRDESKAVTIAQVSLIISIVFSLLCVLAIAAAYNANAKVDYELQETRDERTAMKNAKILNNVYLQELYLIMKDADLEPPPLPEE